jgi:hypothetical protein
LANHTVCRSFVYISIFRTKKNIDQKTVQKKIFFDYWDKYFVQGTNVDKGKDTLMVWKRYGKADKEDLDDYNIPADAINNVDTEPVYEDIASLRGRRESWRVSSLSCWRIASATRVWQY